LPLISVFVSYQDPIETFAKPPMNVTKSQHSALVITVPSYSEAVSSQISPPTSLIVREDSSEVPPALSDNEKFQLNTFPDVLSQALGTKESLLPPYAETWWQFCLCTLE